MKGRNEEEGYFKDLSLGDLPVELSDQICKLLSELKQYGIFLVPKGTLEQWLINTQDTDEDRFIMMLNKVEKTQPTGEDIWKFIDDIGIWISNPNRKGMLD